MKIFEIIFKEICISFSLNHNNFIHEEYLGHIFKFQKMDQARFISRQRNERIFDFRFTIDFCKSVYISNVRFIDKQGRVGREDKLSSDILTNFFYHSRKTSLHLRMKMDLRFIDKD